MVGPREVAVSAFALAVQASAFHCPHSSVPSAALVLRHHAGHNRHKGSNAERPTYRRPRRASTAVRMVSDREQELKDKIAKLRGAASKGDTYERVIGKGSELKGGCHELLHVVSET